MPSQILLYAGNDQTVTLVGVTDANGNPITAATISGSIDNSRGTSLASLIFTAVTGQPGNFAAPLAAVNVPPPGNWMLSLSGVSNGVTIALKIACVVLTRTI